MEFKKDDIIENQLYKNLTVIRMDGENNVWIFTENKIKMRFHTSWMKLIKRKTK